MQSKARKVKTLLAKNKKLLREYYNTPEFKGTAVILMKRGNKLEFYENATAGDFIITHSDGDERVIRLTPNKQHNFDSYAKKNFPCYICHEDYPFPLPEDPLITSREMDIAINKAVNDLKNLQAKEITAKGNMYWKILAGIAVIILAYAAYKLLVPEATSAPQEITIITQNTSNLIQQAKTVLP